MGSAPAIAQSLSKNPSLLDSVLTASFYDPFPDKKGLHGLLMQDMQLARALEDEVLLLRRFKNEKQFQAGVQLLKNHYGAGDVGRLLTNLAELVLENLYSYVLRDFSQRYGVLEGSQLAVIALGKLGARELTFGSDLDIVFVYDGDEHPSDGDKTHGPAVYYNRLVQRYITQLTSLDRDGQFYEIDTRLRPSGNNGPLAVSVEAFDKYFSESAWTFEFMALTRARVVLGDEKIKSQLEAIIQKNMCKKRDEEKLRRDVADMRGKIDQEFGTKNVWNVKYARGGMIDIDFIAQYLILLHAHDVPEIIKPSSLDVFTVARNKRLIDRAVAISLIEAYDFQSRLLNYLRLCQVSEKDTPESTEGLSRLITANFGENELESLKSKLEETQKEVYSHFSLILRT